jgi:hypothetical protein
MCDQKSRAHKAWLAAVSIWTRAATGADEQVLSEIAVAIRPLQVISNLVVAVATLFAFAVIVAAGVLTRSGALLFVVGIGAFWLYVALARLAISNSLTSKLGVRSVLDLTIRAVFGICVSVQLTPMLLTQVFAADIDMRLRDRGVELTFLHRVSELSAITGNSMMLQATQWALGIVIAGGWMVPSFLVSAASEPIRNYKQVVQDRASDVDARIAVLRMERDVSVAEAKARIDQLSKANMLQLESSARDLELKARIEAGERRVRMWNEVNRFSASLLQDSAPRIDLRSSEVAVVDLASRDDGEGPPVATSE